MSFRDRHDGIHLAAHSRVVNGHDRSGFRRNGGLDQGLIDIERIMPNVDEYRHASPQYKSIGSRDERVGRHDDLIPGLDMSKNRRHFQGGRAGMRQQCLAASDAVLQPGAAFLRKNAISREMTIGVSLAHIPQFFSGHVGLIKRNHGCAHSGSGSR